ncbi:glycosyltransferase family 4 protein [Aestuariibacter sp. AA17]|uniref:Glycosyltransferase family 4 protein n=1 Tax=Fluctibacter corallii TaxID=2984329 RepID=A0ABT3ABR9_9ALTE|nr:glycosyltransferase family 4 protein [Aestuariibacter sp. AA17]MCV2886037.1 glycosyltransferase family 4 protein [Aestuariibacter sp. AA17]
MKIGIVTTWFERGAAYVSKQFRDILAADHEVFIYARGGEEYAIGDEKWDHDYVTWGAQPLSHAFTDMHLEDFRAWLETNNIDTVLFNEQKIWAPVLLCRELGIKVGSYIDYYTEQTVPMFGVYDFLVCNTHRHHSAFSWHPNSLFIPWGTDTNLYQYQPEDRDEQAPVRYFHSAGMSPYRKGTDLLLKAFKQVSGNVKLIIHSQVKLEQHFPELKETIASLKAQDKLDVHEYTVSAPGLYHLGDIYVYPSRLDGIGLTILEAGAAGLPIIVPDNGPMNEFVTEGVNGYTAKIEKLWSRWDGYYWPQCEVSIDSLAEAMQIYADKQADISVIKQQARQYAEQHFDWSKNTSALSAKIEGVSKRTETDICDAKALAVKYDKSLFAKHPKSKKTLIAEQLERDYPSLHKALKGVWQKIK